MANSNSTAAAVVTIIIVLIVIFGGVMLFNQDAKDKVLNRDYSASITVETTCDNMIFDSDLTIYIAGEQVDQFHQTKGTTMTHTYNYNWPNDNASTKEITVKIHAVTSIDSQDLKSIVKISNGGNYTIESTV